MIDVLPWKFFKIYATPFRSLYQHIYIYIYIYIYKFASVVEGDQKAPFSIASTPMCRGGRYSFSWIAPLPLIRTLYCWVLSKEVSSTPELFHFTLDTYLILLSVKQGGIKYHFFKSLVWRDLGLKIGLLDHWWTFYRLG